jgi:hypothetical protein
MVLWKRSSSSVTRILCAIFGNDFRETSPINVNTAANVPSAMAKYFERCPDNLPSVFDELQPSKPIRGNRAAVCASVNRGWTTFGIRRMIQALRQAGVLFSGRVSGGKKG